VSLVSFVLNSTRDTKISNPAPVTGLADHGPGSERAKECQQISFLSVAEVDVEPRVVEIYRLLERRGGPVVEIGSTSGKPAQNRPLELADVHPLAGNHRAARVGGLNRGVRGPVLERVQR
jgi:hypothetical protein